MDIAVARPRSDSVSLPGSIDYDTSSVLLQKNPEEAVVSTQYQTSWEPAMAKVVQEKAAVQPKPFLVGLIGIPGSGKSVSSFLLANELEKLGASPMIMPHDGYHYPLSQLRMFPDPEDKVYRRGAPDTFDAAALCRDLDRIRNCEDETNIALPAFDHGKGDPEPDRHAFYRTSHDIVICEGLYLLHDSDGWENVASYLDLTIFIKSDVNACIERLKIRNQCIPGYTPEEIAIRCERVDRVNAEIVMRGKNRADFIVQSLAEAAPTAVVPEILEVPEELTMEQTLTTMTLTDAEIAAEVDTDWTMDITSRMVRGDSIWSEPAERRRANSEVTPTPTPVFIGDWVDDVAKRIANEAQAVIQTGRPYMCALVGMPGSGKSLSALVLANSLEENGLETMILPHDGYHYTLEYLNTFPDPEEMIYHRGRPDTFDAVSLQRDLLRIRDGKEELIKLPAFDHSKGDPEPDTHAFDRHRHKIVLCEGLWLLHNSHGWENVAATFDRTLFLDSDVDTCIERVKIRNQCIPGYSPEELLLRCDQVDRVNAELCLKSKANADWVVG